MVSRTQAGLEKKSCCDNMKCDTTYSVFLLFSPNSSAVKFLNEILFGAFMVMIFGCSLFGLNAEIEQ